MERREFLTGSVGGLIGAGAGDAAALAPSEAEGPAVFALRHPVEGPDPDRGLRGGAVSFKLRLGVDDDVP